MKSLTAHIGNHGLVHPIGHVLPVRVAVVLRGSAAMLLAVFDIFEWAKAGGCWTKQRSETARFIQ